MLGYDTIIKISIANNIDLCAPDTLSLICLTYGLNSRWCRTRSCWKLILDSSYLEFWNYKVVGIKFLCRFFCFEF